MSDIAEGEGWWQASDHKWYPPEQHPNYESPAPEPEPEPPASEPEPEPPTPEPAPPPTPPSVITAPPIPPTTVSTSTPLTPTSSNAKWVAIAVAAAAIVAVAAFLLLSGDSNKNVIASSSSNSGSSSSEPSPSTASSSQLTEAQLQGRMLTAPEIGSTFKEGTFAVDSTSPTPCGQENLNIQVPPTSDLGSQAADAASKAFFREEVSVYVDDATAARAFELGKQGFGCSQGTTANGARFTFSPPRDVSAELGVPGSIAIDYQVGTVTGELIAVQDRGRIVSFQFEAPASVDRTTLPSALTIAKRGLAKLNG